MSVFLRALGGALLVAGIVTAFVTGGAFVRDTQFDDVLAAYARHPEHAVFQMEYWTAAVRHYGLLAAMIGSALGGLSVGGLLIGVGEVLRRLPRAQAPYRDDA